MSTGPCPEPEDFAQFVDGEADAALRARIEGHVDGCDTCLALLADLGRHGDRSTVDASRPSGATPDTMLSPGTELDRFVLLEVIGRGAMGTVHAAYDRQLDRKVAIKLLHHFVVDEDARARLLQEARALGKISHPNVVPVHEVGELDGRLYVVMEHVEGKTLRAWIQERGRPWKELVEVFLQAGTGLAAAHAAGVVHRDFKPDNVLLGDDGRVRVVDFGLARATMSPSVEASAAPSGDASSLVTWHRDETGAIAGTPAYMAPEQWQGEALDGRTDQFAWCVALYEALYRERPFEGDTVPALQRAVLDGRVRPVPAGGGVPASLRRVLLRGLALAPEERWPSMDALVSQLRRLVAPSRARGLAVGVALAGIAVAVAQTVMADSRCEGARAQLDGVWDEARAQAVETAILGTELSYAPDTWGRVEDTLDTYADAWVNAHTEACEATTVRGEQSAEVMDLRMGCLHERRVALRETVGVLVEANAARVEKAVALVTGLPSLSRCDDVEALRAALPPPEDPKVAEAVEVQRERLAHVHSLHQAGELALGLTEAEVVLEQADALSHPPLSAEAALARGRLYAELDRFEEAEDDLERAYLLALEIGHPEVAATASALLIGVTGSNQGQLERGMWWAETALALGRSRRDDPLAEAFALNIMGRELWTQGKHDESFERHQRALEIRRRVHGPEHPEVATSLNNLGTVLWSLGKHEEARDHLTRGLELRERLLGPWHPLVAMSLNNLGIVLSDMGRTDEALVHYRRALEIRERALGPDHTEVAKTRNSIGTALRRKGDIEGALVELQRSREILERALGPRHPLVAMSLNNIAVTHNDMGRLDEAISVYERVLEIRKEVLGDRHAEVAVTLSNMGNTLRRLGRLEEAAQRLSSSREIFEEALGPEHLNLSYPLLNLGEVELAREDLVAAQAAFERSLEIRRSALGPEHLDTIEAQVGLAKVALAKGDDAAARRHAELALTARIDGEAPAAQVAQARYLLAKGLWSEPAERPRALRLAEQAAAADGGTEPEWLELHEEIEAWLASHRDESIQ